MAHLLVKESNVRNPADPPPSRKSKSCTGHRRIASGPAGRMGKNPVPWRERRGKLPGDRSP
jgi:hypothetical protein